MHSTLTEDPPPRRALAHADARVGIVVVNWKRRDFTLRCLESLAGLVDCGARTATVVVDNESDGSLAAAVRVQFPQVDVVAHPSNVGYAAALNAGAAHLRKTHRYDYFWFINNDVVVEGDSLSSLLDAMQSDPRIGVAGPLVYNPSEHAKLERAGFRVSHWTGRHKYLVPGKDVFRERDTTLEDVDSAYGCANLVRWSAFEHVNGFDGHFNVYFEETDFNVRVRKEEFRVVVVKNARVYHVEGGTMNHYILRRAFYLLRNLVLFQMKHATVVQLAFFFPYFALVHLPYFLVRGSVYGLQVFAKHGASGRA